ncbi:MAG: ABC transporter ATP-binding protein [Verrucomicrobiota bacterium]|nr:ABC transporter ATP-binding protein [Verrucomicrobiota bacterium]
MNFIVKIENLGKVFHSSTGPLRVLDDINFTLSAGDFSAVYGASGSGKSTLLFIIGGLLSPTEGTISVNNVNPYKLSVYKRSEFRMKTVGFVFQQFYLIPYLNILDNVLLPELARKSSEKNKEKALSLLDKFNLSDRLNHIPSALSSGEQQRTALARALLYSPDIILADEPTGNLDAENSKIILDALKDYVSTGGMVLIATHDPEALKYADKKIELKK